jgi:hypothetical protein
MDGPSIAELVLVGDVAINVAPALVGIVRSTVDLAIAVGIDEPKVDGLAPMETVNPKIQSAVDTECRR